MPEAAPAARPWPRPVTTFFLLLYVLVDAALWMYASYQLLLVGTVEERHEMEVHLSEAGTYLTLALVLMLLGGWAWRWAVAAGRIGGRPTARFGGA